MDIKVSTRERKPGGGRLFTEDEIREIRTSGLPAWQEGLRRGVSDFAIGRIRRRQAYAWVTDTPNSDR